MLLTPKNLISSFEQRELEDNYTSIADIPHFSLMKDMDKGAKRIADAIRKKENIYLVGDYDADGVSATATCVSFFRDIQAPLQWLIPDRFKDGYGVSAKIIERIEDADVIFSVDNGIVAFDAATIAKQKSIDLIITDHHTTGASLPNCYAVINPKQEDCGYPVKEISGCFVAWLLCCAIKHELQLTLDMRKYLDLVALSTITDVMPLRGINRQIVKYGLKKINGFSRPFFKELALSIAKDSFSYEDLGFQVGPRINAAGRLEHASHAVDALISDEKDAYRHIQNLSTINNLRKSMQSEMADLVLELAKGQKDFILVHSDALHEGIVGILASKVAETFGYPTIILSTAKDGLLKGSGRSIGVVNIFALVDANRSFLEKFGGHAGACGLSLKAQNLQAFGDALRRSSQSLAREDFIPLDGALGELAPKDANLELFYQLESFTPFGQGNPPPVFHCTKAKILSAKAVGKEADHTRLLIDWEHTEVTIMAFGRDASEFNTQMHIAFNYRLDLNIWNNRSSLQFMPVGAIHIL